MHPAAVGRDLDEPREEAGAADADLALGELGGDVGEPPLVLVPAQVLPAREEEEEHRQGREHPHRLSIGDIRVGS